MKSRTDYLFVWQEIVQIEVCFVYIQSIQLFQQSSSPLPPFIFFAACANLLPWLVTSAERCWCCSNWLFLFCISAMLAPSKSLLLVSVWPTSPFLLFDIGFAVSVWTGVNNSPLLGSSLMASEPLLLRASRSSRTFNLFAASLSRHFCFPSTLTASSPSAGASKNGHAVYCCLLSFSSKWQRVWKGSAGCKQVCEWVSAGCKQVIENEMCGRVHRQGMWWSVVIITLIFALGSATTLSHEKAAALDDAETHTKKGAAELNSEVLINSAL